MRFTRVRLRVVPSASEDPLTRQYRDNGVARRNGRENVALLMRHLRYIGNDFIQLSGVPREIPDLTDEFLAELGKPENNTRGRSATKESGESDEQSDEEEGCLSEGDDDRPPKSHAMLGEMANQICPVSSA